MAGSLAGVRMGSPGPKGWEVVWTPQGGPLTPTPRAGTRERPLGPRGEGLSPVPCRHACLGSLFFSREKQARKSGSLQWGMRGQRLRPASPLSLLSPAAGARLWDRPAAVADGRPGPPSALLRALPDPLLDYCVWPPAGAASGPQPRSAAGPTRFLRPPFLPWPPLCRVASSGLLFLVTISVSFK